MSETFWGDLGMINRRLASLEKDVQRLAGTTPADLAAKVVGLECALGVAERTIRELASKVEALEQRMAPKPGPPPPDPLLVSRMP